MVKYTLKITSDFTDVITGQLRERGYAAAFAVGFEDAKTFIDWYLR